MKTSNRDTGDGKEEGRLLAVLALLRGEPAAQVCRQYSICRSDLYKFRRRALAAMRYAMKDKMRGSRLPFNRLAPEKEQRIKALSQCRPTLSSYQLSESLAPDSPSPRTVQRVRKRLRLPRLRKRAAPSFKAHRLSHNERQLIRGLVEAKLHLGPYRLAWDLQNQYGLRISPSTVRRVKRAILRERHPPPALPAWRFYERHHPHSLWHGDFFEKVTLTDEGRTAYQLTLLDDYSRAYVYCGLLREPTQNDTIRALIAAMRQYQTIPKGVVFDNGSQFKGYLLSAFCSKLGIRLIHASVRHPQTNGKLERAFRDDRREYYDQFKEWLFDELRQGLPEYVSYRNGVRGHYALGGKPSTTRLREQNWLALPSVLARLESYARHPLGSTKVDLSCCIRVFGRNGYIPRLRYGQRVSLTETLDGLEAETEEGRLYLLRDYRRLRQVPISRRDELPFCLNFEKYGEGHCPRIAVA
jgi:transposase InsO family protein